MAKDPITAKFKVDIQVTLIPVNKYGDELDQGSIRYTKTLEVKNMVELGVYLERLNSQPFEYIQMVDPPGDESAPILGDEGPPF
jgi:hypothetical protein